LNQTITYDALITMVRDFFEILSQCIASVNSGVFFRVVLLALMLGTLCWVGCSYSSRLWHKRFHVKVKHHVLCAIAAVLTVVFTVLFCAVGNLKFIVNDMIDQWSEKLLENDEWHSQTYTKAFYAVKELYPDEFSGVPQPGTANSYIPFNNEEMKQICVKMYVIEACNNFSTRHPFLDKILKARPGISKEDIINDIREYFKINTNGIYPLCRAVVIATEHIREGLLKQSPKTVRKTRGILVALFLAVQMFPFGMIGYCAYKELKIFNFNIKQQ